MISTGQCEHSAFQRALDDLTALRDGLRVRAHLMSLEACEQWDDAEEQIIELEQTAGRLGADATIALIAKTRELSARFRELLHREY